MRNVLVVLAVLAVAVPAIAGQNPYLGLYLYTTSTGVGGTNWANEPAPNATRNVRVFADHFGPGGGLKGISFKFNEHWDGYPEYLSVVNKLGGLIIGIPPTGIAMTAATGTVAYPDGNGILYVAEIKYAGPEELRGGYIELTGHPTDGRAAADGNNELDFWCVHSVEYNGLSGHFGWGAPPPIDGDCVPPSPVESTTWGAIKALYK